MVLAARRCRAALLLACALVETRAFLGVRCDLPVPAAVRAARVAPHARRLARAGPSAAAEFEDYKAVTHDWESKPDPSFDYEETAPLLESGGLLAGIAACRRQNDGVLPLFEELQTRDFFSFFAVDLMNACAYMPTEEEPCDRDGCSIEPADDTVPDAMRERDESEYEFELDSWARWDQPSDFTEYYDLRVSGEANTEYDGSRVWKFIHAKVAFQGDLSSSDEHWRRDFNRVLSGFHSAVSAHIIHNTADEAVAREKYARLLRDQPGAVPNLYFTYMLALCAIREAAPRLDVCSYLGDGAVPPTMRRLTSHPLLSDPAVQLAASNLREHARSPAAATRLWEARLRMRDLLKIMNCVQCNLCRLHGKVAALGLSAAFRVLLGDGQQLQPGMSLNRVEVGALVATAAKLGAACAVVERYVEREGDDGVVRAMFGRVDADGSGSIDVDELASLCAALGRQLTADEQQAVLAKLDADANGSISFEEFSAWWKEGFSFDALQRKA